MTRVPAALARWLALEDDRRLLVVGGASLDVLHVGGTPTPSAGGAGLYTALAAAREGEPGAADQLIRLASDPLYPTLVRATALGLLQRYPGDETTRAINAGLQDRVAQVLYLATF